MSTPVGAAPAIERAGRLEQAAASRRPEAAAASADFGALLERRLQGAEHLGELRWSAHAVARMTQGRIAVSEQMQERLAGAVDDLAAKGAREILVLVDGLAFVVSVTNRTVITAVADERMHDQIFTNIDSAAVR
jgi:flagellar operon protein